MNPYKDKDFTKSNVNAGVFEAVRLLAMVLVSALLLSACGSENTQKKYDQKSQDLITHFSAKSLEKRLEAGNTPLLVATQKNLTEVARYLIKRGAKVNVQNKNGTSPLMMAASHGNAELAALLLEQKSTIDISDKFGYTAMFYAVEQKSASVIKKLLVAGAKPSIKAEFGWTVIMVLASERESYLETIKMFHKRGVNLSSVESQFGLSALAMNSMLQGDYSVFKYLVDNGAKINSLDKMNRTPLLYALVNKNVAKIRYLMKKGANPRIGLYKGLTPLMLASARGDALAVRLLVNHGAKPMYRNKHGKTAIDYARKKRFRGIMSYLKKH